MNFSPYISLEAVKTQEKAETESTHAQSNDCATQMDSWNKPRAVFVCFFLVV